MSSRLSAAAVPLTNEDKRIRAALSLVEQRRRDPPVEH